MENSDEQPMSQNMINFLKLVEPDNGEGQMIMDGIHARRALRIKEIPIVDAKHVNDCGTNIIGNPIDDLLIKETQRKQVFVVVGDSGGEYQKALAAVEQIMKDRDNDLIIKVITQQEANDIKVRNNIILDDSRIPVKSIIPLRNTYDDLPNLIDRGYEDDYEDKPNFTSQTPPKQKKFRQGNNRKHTQRNPKHRNN